MHRNATFLHKADGSRWPTTTGRRRLETHDGACAVVAGVDIGVLQLRGDHVTLVGVRPTSYKKRKSGLNHCRFSNSPLGGIGCIGACLIPLFAPKSGDSCQLRVSALGHLLFVFTSWYDSTKLARIEASCSEIGRILVVHSMGNECHLVLKDKTTISIRSQYDLISSTKRGIRSSLLTHWLVISGERGSRGRGADGYIIEKQSASLRAVYHHFFASSSRCSILLHHNKTFPHAANEVKEFLAADEWSPSPALHTVRPLKEVTLISSEIKGHTRGYATCTKAGKVAVIVFEWYAKDELGIFKIIRSIGPC
ncbi:hypothetical protein EVAR_92989_1 [Eumeta japonica]|uniref:Uncharacterized protein n=1 Tax=Eumeta variegata TaxID=151549 RepID=A0A4C1TBL0_EUMVA|nr:hypothetical protein EVAR_92989_1 [Eumeta japonica]